MKKRARSIPITSSLLCPQALFLISLSFLSFSLSLSSPLLHSFRFGPHHMGNSGGASGANLLNQLISGRPFSSQNIEREKVLQLCMLFGATSFSLPNGACCFLLSKQRDNNERTRRQIRTKCSTKRCFLELFCRWSPCWLGERWKGNWTHLEDLNLALDCPGSTLCFSMTAN